MKKQKENDDYSWKNIFMHFFVDLISIIFDPRDGSPDDGLYDNWEEPEFGKAFNNDYCKKKYWEIWGFFILIICLIISIITKIWNFTEINLLIILLILAFIFSLILIIRGIIAKNPNKLNEKK